MKKITAILLSIIAIFSIMAPCAAAAEEVYPVVYVS